MKVQNPAMLHFWLKNFVRSKPNLKKLVIAKLYKTVSNFATLHELCTNFYNEDAKNFATIFTTR